LANGVELIDGTVMGVDINSGDGLHTVTVQDPAGGKQTLGARWLVDATGRNRVLAKQLQLQEAVKEQKNVFWFRLMNFNPEILSRIKALKKQNRAYVPYFATHHFFGKGNWIWYIPMRSPENVPLVSIGITYRKDVFPHGEVRTMEQFYRMRAVSIFKVLVTIVGAMGLMGLGLSIVGLYGLVAYAVSRRTREIGIRMAIGAGRASVLRMVLRQGMGLALAGLAVGLVASVGAGDLLQAAFPSGDDQRDVVALMLVVPIVLAVTFLAAYIPARHAARVNPIQALRCE
jgi:hypothetical protein